MKMNPNIPVHISNFESDPTKAPNYYLTETFGEQSPEVKIEQNFVESIDEYNERVWGNREAELVYTPTYAAMSSVWNNSPTKLAYNAITREVDPNFKLSNEQITELYTSGQYSVQEAQMLAEATSQEDYDYRLSLVEENRVIGNSLQGSGIFNKYVVPFATSFFDPSNIPLMMLSAGAGSIARGAMTARGIAVTANRAKAISFGEGLATNAALDAGIQEYWKGYVDGGEVAQNTVMAAGIMSGAGMYAGLTGMYRKHKGDIMDKASLVYKKSSDALDTVFNKNNSTNAKASEERATFVKESLDSSVKDGIPVQDAVKIVEGTADNVKNDLVKVTEEPKPLKTASETAYKPFKGEALTKSQETLTEAIKGKGEGIRVSETAHAYTLDNVLDNLNVLFKGFSVTQPKILQDLDLNPLSLNLFNIFAKNARGRGWKVVYDSSPNAVSKVSLKEGIITLKANKGFDGKDSVSVLELMDNMTAGEIRALMHETAHANLGMLLDSPKELLTKAQQKDAEELRRIAMSIPKDVVGKKHQSVHERLAQAFSNQAVQNYLIGQKAPEAKNLWQKIKQLVARIFGMNDKNSMDYLTRILKRQALPDDLAKMRLVSKQSASDIHYMEGLYEAGLTQKEQADNFNAFVKRFEEKEKEPVKQKQISEIRKYYTPYIKGREKLAKDDQNTLDYFISAGMRAALSEDARVRAIGSILLDTPTAVGREAVNVPYWFSRVLGSYSSRYAHQFNTLFMDALGERGYNVSRFRRFFNIAGGFGDDFKVTAQRVYTNAFEIATLRRNVELANSGKGSPDMARYKGLDVSDKVLSKKYTPSEIKLANLWDSFIDEIVTEASTHGVDKAEAVKAMTTKGYMRRKWNVPLLNKLASDKSPQIVAFKKILSDRYYEAILSELKAKYFDPEYAEKKFSAYMEKRTKEDSEAGVVKSLGEYKNEYNADLNAKLEKRAQKAAINRANTYFERIISGNDFTERQRTLDTAKSFLEEAVEDGDFNLEDVFAKIEDELNDVSRTEFDILREVDGVRLIDFMDTNMLSNMGSHIREFAGRIGLAEAGFKTAKSVDDFRVLLATENLPEDARKLFNDYLDFYMGILDTGNNTLSNAFAQLAVTAQMGRIGFNQAGDMLNGALIAGCKDTASRMPSRFADLFSRLLDPNKRLTKPEIDDLNDFLSDFAKTSGDLLGDEHLARINARFNTTDPNDPTSFVPSAIQATGQVFGYLTGAYLIQRSTQKMNFELVARSLIDGALGRESNLTSLKKDNPEGYKRLLNELGLTEDNLAKIAEETRKHGRFDANGDVQQLNLANWDADTAILLDAVLRREVSHMSMRTLEGGQPWGLLKSSTARLLLQYRTTGLTAAEIQTTKGLTLGARQFVPVFAMQAGYSALLYTAKTLAIASSIPDDSKRDKFIKNRFDCSTPENLFTNLTAYLNLLPWAGWFPDGLGIVGVTAGIVDPKTVLVPPALSQLEQTLQAPSRVTEGVYNGDITKIQQGLGALPLGTLVNNALSVYHQSMMD